MSWFGILLLAALCGGIGCAINQAKNRSGGEGFALGFLLGLIGIIIVLCLPKLSSAEMPRAWPSALPPPGWYQDPADPTQHRWWDGQRWSDPPPTAPLPPAAEWV
jgi:hypothetical protein